jgi:hypothetical protein
MTLGMANRAGRTAGVLNTIPLNEMVPACQEWKSPHFHLTLSKFGGLYVTVAPYGLWISVRCRQLQAGRFPRASDKCSGTLTQNFPPRTEYSTVIPEKGLAIYHNGAPTKTRGIKDRLISAPARA